jgi:flagellar protein FlbD
VIKVRLIGDNQIVLNSDMIEFIEATPDTVISLSNGKKLIVRESVSEVVDKIVDFRLRLQKSAQDLVRTQSESED